MSARAEEERHQTLHLMDIQILEEVEELRLDNHELKAQKNFWSEGQHLRDFDSRDPLMSSEWL